MSIYKTKEFARFARKAELDDETLRKAAEAVARGQVDADLGGVFKQRIARDGGGKSGGFRTIILFRVGAHCFLVHGFAKNAKANVTTRELKALKGLADTLLGLDAKQLSAAKAAGELMEIGSDDKDTPEG
ncbi:MAG: type II toxin-antitoxin system RelE/ParE family toxin [Caulobacter sp.]|nr:type II toxin-antitoxin system RelE/ParE family toxin [Caulobacter sp.]